MISRSNRFIRAVHVSLVVISALLIPLVPAWSQETAPGTLTVPPAESAQQPAAEPGTLSSSAAEAAVDEPGTYTIREGDTLWDISNAHYRDPFLWPLIWKSNPSIDDPDLIYPGNVLAIPSMEPVERAISAPEEPAPAAAETIEEKKAPEVAAPAPPAERDSTPSFFRQKRVESVGPEPEAPVATSRLILPEDTRPTLLDKYGILSGGFVSNEPSDDSILTHTIDPSKNLFGYDDVVYLSIKSRQDVKAGDLFLIYEPLHEVRHPVNRRKFGKLNRVVGVIQVTAVKEGGPHVGRIVQSFDAAGPGNLLTPYQEPEPLYAPTEKRQKDLKGYVLEVTDRRSINAQVDVVYLDKGEIDGVEPGDRFSVISMRMVDIPSKGRVKMPEVLGEVQVFLVKQRTSTAIVKKSTDAISRGNRVEYKN
jgi:hypothetical protein